MKEDQHIEWKQSWRDEFLKWISGFANADGGVLHIGRNDKGVVVGVPNAARLMEDIPNKVRDILGIMVEVNLRRKAGKEYLEIVVEPHPNPISYRGEYYRRSGSTNQALKGSALDTFLLRKHGRRWDAVPFPGFHRKDCSRPAFRLFRTRAARSGRMTGEVLRDSDSTLLENLELTEGMYLRRAAALLFSDEPDKFVSGAHIKIGFFVTDDDLRYQDEVHGSLFKQVDETIELLKVKYLKAYIRYEGLQRIEEFLFPELALREAILNAVVHKDYSSGIPIQISAYDDKVVVWNSGQLPENWTLERLHEKHPSVPYNPLLASAFFRAGYIEAWGRGIEKIDRECREHDTAPPVYDYRMSGLMLTFHANPRHLVRARIVAPPENAEDKLGERLGEKLGETRAVIVQAMQDDSKVTVVRLAKLLGMSTTAVEKNIDYLKSHGHVKRHGPAKGGSWEVLR